MYEYVSGSITCIKPAFANELSSLRLKWLNNLKANSSKIKLEKIH